MLMCIYTFQNCESEFPIINFSTVSSERLNLSSVAILLSREKMRSAEALDAGNANIRQASFDKRGNRSEYLRQNTKLFFSSEASGIRIYSSNSFFAVNSDSDNDVDSYSRSSSN